MALTREDILRGLQDLGLQPGMVVMAHVSLSAFGEIEGGADTLIQALIDAVGPEGTLCMPAMSGEQPFNVATSPSNTGIVTERFRSWPGVVRGLHPTHSASCLGPKAEELVRGHIDQPTALGPASPWGRIAQLPEGHILLLGCDQDRNTLLHSAEEAVDGPYLHTITRDYLDENGQRKTKSLARFPGPHRDFIGLDGLFREAGAMRVGKVGRAVCRLMPAGKILELATAALRRDPAAVLCTNPSCQDCVRQRSDIFRHRFAAEDFTLAAVVDDLGYPVADLAQAIAVIQSQGIDCIELGEQITEQLGTLASDQLPAIARSIHSAGASVSTVSYPGGHNLTEAMRHAADLAQVLGARRVKLPRIGREGHEKEEALEGIGALATELAAEGLELLVENWAGSLFDTKSACEELVARVPGVRLAFHPAHFCHAGEKPFLQSYYKGKLKSAVGQLYISDGCRPGGAPYTLPGEGQGEVKELMSILRCRSFDGTFCLTLGNRTGKEAFLEQAKAFRHLLDTL